MKKFTIFTFLTFLIVSVFSLTDTLSLTPDLCAAQTIYSGLSCTNQQSTCPSGYEIASDFFSRASYRQIESVRVMNAFNRVYPNGLNTICINSSFSTIIPVFTSSTLYDTNYYVYLDEINRNVPEYDVEVPKLCPPGWVADQGNYAHRLLGAGGNFPPWGCCPPGYNFINRGNDAAAVDANSYQPGVCAKPIIDGQVPDRLDVTDQDKGIYAKDGSVIVNFDASPGYAQFSSWAELQSQIGTADYIYSYSSGTPGIAGAVQPQLGQGFGSFFNNTTLEGSVQPRLVTGTAFTGSSKACPSTASCAFTDGDDFNTVINASRYKTETGLACSKCFVDGEVMGYTDVAATGFPEGFVAFCKEGAIDRKPLINGSITDTVEYYLTDPTNQPLLAQCRASGGIYTAIGCVDPSPIGLITGLIRIALGVIGGVALLQLIWVGIQYQLGNEEKIREARSRLIATITGVAVLVFSILILRIIGVNVLDVLPAGSI